MNTRSFALPSGRQIEVEVAHHAGFDRPVIDEFAPAGPRSVIERAVHSALDIQGSLTALAELADTTIDSMVNSARHPEEINLEIALKIGFSGKLIIAGGSTEGSIKLTLKYKIPAEPQSNDA